VFTGIIEQTGVIRDIITEGSNKHFWISSSLTPELKIDQSVSHNGICLTVVERKDDAYRVTAIAETLTRTNLDKARVNDLVNLERCMPANGRFDGHIVQGHVDDTATCIAVENKNGSWVFTFETVDPSHATLLVEKGSICINGISLTLVSVNARQFSVAIIPYTFEHTNIHTLQPGSEVNIEYDIIGKYIARMLAGR
jgi:riboflavin synthase